MSLPEIYTLMAILMFFYVIMWGLYDWVTYKKSVIRPYSPVIFVATIQGLLWPIFLGCYIMNVIGFILEESIKK